MRTSQWKHQMLPQHMQLCAAQRTGHATQSRPSVCPKNLTACGRPGRCPLASSAAMPSARASEQRKSEGGSPLETPRITFFVYRFIN